MMATERDLRRWVEAGLLDSGTAERILAFERERAPEQREPSARPGVTELLVYFGVAIAAAGFTVLTATNWEHLAGAARVAIPAVSSAVALALGYSLRRAHNEQLLRAASLLWLLAGALGVVTVAVATNEASWSENQVALSSGVAAAIVSIALWAAMRTHVQVVGVGAAAFLFSMAVSTPASEDWIFAALGGSLALCGLAAMIAVESNIFTPRATGRLVASVSLAAGAFWAGLPPSPPVTELLALVVVIVLVTAGIRFRSLLYVAFGVISAFAAMLKLILRHVEDPTLAGLALIAIGLLLSITIAGLSLTRPWSRWGRRPSSGMPRAGPAATGSATRT